MYYFARVLSVYMKSSVLDNYLSVIFAGTYREYLYYSLGLETIIAPIQVQIRSDYFIGFS